MVFLSNTLARVKPSATIAVSTKAAELKTQGKTSSAWALVSPISTRLKISKLRLLEPFMRAKLNIPPLTASPNLKPPFAQNSPAKMVLTTSLLRSR